jgi:signal transduction histidine kinase
MMKTASIEDLQKVIAFKDLPDEHLQWILDRAEYSEYEDGDLVGKYGDEAEKMIILLAGKFDFYMYVNGRQVYYFTFENDKVSGGVTGLIPYSRMKTYPGYSYASAKVKSLHLHKKYFSELEQLNPDLIQRLVGYMTERARAFATTQLQHEKVNALGNLAAGIAHELNNPAAAINRIAHELGERLNRNYELTKKLLQSDMIPQHIKTIQALVESIDSGASPRIKLPALRRMEYEDQLTEWLGKQGISGREMAETFSELAVSTTELDSILREVGQPNFILLMPWLENLLGSHKIIRDLNEASGHISKLVGSIKSYVHMDRTHALQPTDIHRDIENTLTLFGYKLRGKNIRVIKKFHPDLPEVPAYVGELNQVWTNLIDNAIFAMTNNGVLTIETDRDQRNITVDIADNGAGIPREIISRIFDPFFTTKKFGEGTGIGLDIVKRIVKHHQGEIKVVSEPGRTEFSVCLPLEQKPEST